MQRGEPSRGQLLRGGGESRSEYVANDILSYLLQHPAAADTFEGIVRWRILEEIARRNVAFTEDAMNWLIEKGFLNEEKLPSGHSIYRLNEEKRKEAESMVRRGKEKQPARVQRSGLK